MKHPDHGKVADISREVESETNSEDAYVKLYCHTGYGSQDVVREIILYERPDAIMLITDPRFFNWFMPMEHELKTHYGIPIIWINIWDNQPIPYYNSSSYESMDLLFSINKGTKVINAEILKHAGKSTCDLDKGETPKANDVLLKYLPHGLNPETYYKVTESSKDWSDFNRFKVDFYKANPDIEFLVFYNSRNIRRKQAADVILAFRRFCDRLYPEQAKKCCLFMKTHIVDENGTDLMAVKKAICPKYKVLFNQENIPSNVMNWFYNIADVTMFMSSAEGFGLAANESLLAETMLIAPVTGGLQDQMRFEDENGEWIKFDSTFTSNHRGRYRNCGKWVIPVFPRSRLLQGSVVTPYIFDDCSDAEDGANALMKVYSMSKVEREDNGKVGRQWLLSDESGMSSTVMCNQFTSTVNLLFDNWKARDKYELIKIEEPTIPEFDGIVW